MSVLNELESKLDNLSYETNKFNIYSSEISYEKSKIKDEYLN